MQKGQSPKLKGAIYNLPLDVFNVSNTLSRPADSNNVIIVKSKKTRGHVYFELVGPNLFTNYSNFQNKITNCIMILQ